MSSCGKIKGCYREPDNCEDDSVCDVLITWTENGDKIEFEVSGKSQYVSFGFSRDRFMGDDSIHACLRDSDSNPCVRTYYAYGQNLPEELSNYKGIIEISTELNNSIMRCRFTRKKNGEGIQIFDLNSGSSYHLLTANGIVLNSKMEYHSSKRKSTINKIDFTKYQDIGNNAALLNIKTYNYLITFTIIILNIS